MSVGLVVVSHSAKVAEGVVELAGQMARPKQGFDVPIGAWLKGPLRSWAADLLSDSRLQRQSLLDAPRIQNCWQEHLSGRRDHSRSLWAVLMLQSWLDTTVGQSASRAADVLEPAQ